MGGKINIGILGCSNVAKKYAINAFKSLENVGKVFIASRNTNKAQACAAEFEIQAENSYESLLSRTDIHAIYIPLPIGLHEKWIIKAAKTKKHIICEKSLSNSLESVKRIITCCKKNQVVLYENFMCDYHPQHKKVIESINNEEIGEPFTIKSYFGFPPLDKNSFRYNKNLGGGSLNDAGAYTVFMARKIFDSEPIAVTCNLNLDQENGVDIQGSAYLEFPGNKFALLAFGFNNVYQNNYSIWGTKGTITVNPAFSIPPTMDPDIELFRNENFKNQFTKIKAQAANHFELIFNDFCKTIISNNSSKMKEKYKQILKQAKVMEAMRESALKNKKIVLEEENV